MWDCRFDNLVGWVSLRSTHPTTCLGDRMLTLYFAPGASSMAVHIALHEIGVAFEGRPLSFKQQDLRAPDFLALNPEGKVPVLVIDGRPLTEVAAILYYLAKRFPDAELLPRDDIEADAQALSWMSFIASTLHPARRHGLDYAREVYGIADRRLGDGWALARYSIADIHLFRLYWRLANSLHPAPDMFPNLTAHYARMMARPAVQRTIEVETAVGYELPA
jgi:glutathione S-transferase